MMDNCLTVDFSIRRFTSTRDKDFTKALIIYNATIPVDTKTSSSEIIYHVDHAKASTKREMYFFGLFVEDLVVGFVEAGYLFTTKTIIIDYIVLKEGYRLNSIFYPLFSLVQKYFAEHLIDYDFIAAEVSTKCLEESVDTESFFSRKMLQLEDFRIVDALYRQPRLGIGNVESNFDFQLMIRSAQSISTIKKQTYLAIVKDIFFEHYYSWYDITDHEHSKQYIDHIKNEYQQIEAALEKTPSDNLQLVIQAPLCAYYKAPDCHFNSSTAGYIPDQKPKRKAILFIGVPIIVVCAFALSLLIYYMLGKIGIQPDKFSGLFAAITAICTGIFTLVFSVIFKKS